MRLLSGPTWMTVSRYVDYVFTCLAIPINLLLLYCIVTQSDKGIGRYKWLMAYFSCQSIFFSILASVTHMSFHTIGGSFMMFTLSNPLHLPPWGIWVLLGGCCVSVGYVLLTLAAQFLYRYYAMTGRIGIKGKNTYFFGWRMVYFLLAMLIVAVVYGGCGFAGIHLTPEKDLDIRERMAMEYNVTADKIHYVAVEYFTRDANGTRKWNYSSTGTALALNFVFTATPTILIFIPCIIFYALPFFEIPLGADANILSITLVIYPAVDPIGVLFIMKSYRKFVVAFLMLLSFLYVKFS
ncbi:hypothetical protein B9Z55_014735 [Caenorhabditis nigoni]|uniref:Uncharacterized protein n=1 Tax=Caenorhabditis nigoni TaxID=1611254 RepID=A0A2G5U734_9PELO|nr:hypothetical protein B9Z55_014735 [Caenorhabditis nigoni]